MSTLFGWAPRPFTPPDVEELMENRETFERVGRWIEGIFVTGDG